MSDDQAINDTATPAFKPAAVISELRTSAELGDLAGALAEAQVEIKNPEKNRTVHVVGRGEEGGIKEYEFQYATIDVVLDAARPVLGKHGLAFVQPVVETAKGTALITRLLHSSGQWIESSILIGPYEDKQGLGSAITYLKRYALCALIGLAGEDDEDANVADGHRISRMDNKDFWGGPLLRTQLAKAGMALNTDITACEDLSSLDALLSEKTTFNVLEQYKRDDPVGYHGKDGSDIEGLRRRIDKKREELAKAEALGERMPAGFSAASSQS